jgi:hypothetical protein
MDNKYGSPRSRRWVAEPMHVLRKIRLALLALLVGTTMATGGVAADSTASVLDPDANSNENAQLAEQTVLINQDQAATNQQDAANTNGDLNQMSTLGSAQTQNAQVDQSVEQSQNVTQMINDSDANAAVGDLDVNVTSMSQ